MPNRTIYVSDADLTLYEKAQQLAGGNLSAAITEALRRFVTAREGKANGFEEITIKVGTVAHRLQKFRGRVLAKGRVYARHDTRKVMYTVYQTAKANFAVYIQDMPNWNVWANHSGRASADRRTKRPPRDWHHDADATTDWSDWKDISAYWTHDDSEYRLEVYASLEELEPNVPPEVYEAVAHVLHSDSPDGAELLDI